MSSAICFNLNQSRIGNGLPSDKILDKSKFKAVEDDKIYVAKLESHPTTSC